MSLATLFTTPLTRQIHSAGVEDDYGNAVDTWAPDATYLGRLEQRSGIEVTRDRQTYISDWVFYTYSTNVFSVEDRATDEFGRIFEVLSLAQQPGRSGNHHLEVSLRHVDGG